ncbi:MAG: zinc-ribbon domain-containing protein [Planctomycetota bacterium]|jgi:hypothetical protein|nr:zinc-ribbon domain-containing protein [Planctomycetota bacterium]
MMQIYCPNPNCGATYRLPDEKAGIKFHCQKCRQVVFTDAEKRLTAPPPPKKTPPPAVAPTAPSPRPAASAAPVRISPPIPVLKKTAAFAPAKNKYAEEDTVRIMPKLQAAVVPPPNSDDEVLYEIDGNDEMNAGADTAVLPDEFIEQLHKSQVESGLVEW